MGRFIFYYLKCILHKLFKLTLTFYKVFGFLIRDNFYISLWRLHWLCLNYSWKLFLWWYWRRIAILIFLKVIICLFRNDFYRLILVMLILKIDSFFHLNIFIRVLPSSFKTLIFKPQILSMLLIVWYNISIRLLNTYKFPFNIWFWVKIWISILKNITVVI